MEPSKCNADQEGQSSSDLPEFVASSDSSFSPFVALETQNHNTSENEFTFSPHAPEFLPHISGPLPSDQSCAVYKHVLNIEIQAHANTQALLLQEAMKLSKLERCLVHQTLELGAWQASYNECLANAEKQAEEIRHLKEEIEQLNNNQQEHVTCSWRDSFMSASV